MTKAEERRAFLQAQKSSQPIQQATTPATAMTLADQRRMELKQAQQVTQPVAQPTPQVVTQPVQQPIRGTTNQQTTTLPNSLNIKNNIVQQANNAMPSFKDFQVEYNKGKNEANKELSQKGNELKGRDIENYDNLLTKAETEHNTKDTVKYRKLKEEAEKQVKEKAKTASADDYDLDFTSQSNNINMLGNEVQRNAKLYEDMTNLGASQEELSKIANNYQTALNEYNEALNKYYDNQYYDKYKNNNMFRDIAESFGKNVLGGTATPINFGTAATSKLIGNDATTINAEQLLQYNNGQGFNGKDVERILGGIIPSPMSIINNATGRNEGPATAYAHLALLAQTHPNSRKLQNLLSAISNHSYAGTAEDLKKDLDEAQKEMYQDFKNRTTQDDLNRVAEQTAHNERAYENMAWIPNAFGTVGNMVPSMLVGGAAGGLAELAGGGSMAVAGTAANTLQRVGSLGTLGLGAGGSAMDEAIRNGATYNQAMEYGALKGATEAGTEVLGGETVNRAFGQVGESALGKVFGKAIGKLNIKSAIGQKLAKIGTDIAGEMTEEMIAEAVDPLWRQLTYDNGAIKDYGTIDQWKNVFKAGLEAIPSTLIMQGGNVVLNKTSQLENGIIKSIQASDNLTPESKQALIQQVQEASKQMVQEINTQAQNTQNNTTIANKVAELNKQGFNIPQSTANTLQAIQDVRGTRIEFDDTIDGNGVYDAKNRIIYLNPTQHARAIEFTIAHELGHDIKAGNLEDYNKLQKAVLDYAGKKQGFTEGMQALDNTYRSKLGEGNYDINDEMTNDILGEVLGNQEFLDSLAQKQPNLFQKVWNWIKNVLIDNTNGRLSFEERRMLNKYEQGFRNAYQKAFNGTQQQGTQQSLSEDGLPIVRTLNNSQLKNLAKATGSEMSYIEANIEDADIDEAKNFIVRHTNLVDNYIKEKGINIEKSYKPVEFSRVRGEKLHQFVKGNNINVAKLANNSDLLNEYLDLWFEDYPPQLVEENKKKWKDIFEAGKEPAYMPSVLKSFEREFQYINNNVNQIEDTASLDEAKDKIIESQDFQNYLNNILDGVYEKNTYEPDDVMEEAIANHGTTNDYNTGAYMTTDGQLLDFYDGGYTRDDHRTVNAFGMNMTDFIGYGAIRMKPELNGFELSQEPTEAQYDRLEDYINTHVQNNPDGGKISIDIDKDGKTVDGATYDRNTPADVIIRDLKQYFRTGKFPVKSKYADFYYSKQNQSWQQFLDNTYGKWNTGTKTNFEQLPSNEELQQAERDSVANEPIAMYSLSEEQQNEVNDYIRKLTNDTTIDDNFKDQILTRFDNLTDYKQFENIKQDVEDYKEKAYQGIKSLVDVANMKPEDVSQRPMEYTQRKDKNTPNQRRFFDNMETSNIIADETKNRVNATTYEQKANLDTLEQVRQKLDERGNDMIEEWKHKSKNFTDKDVALGAILIERYQQAGDWNSAARAIEKLADMGTEAGRAVQMYSIFQRLSPETMALYQQKALDKAFEEMKQRKTGKWVEANKDKYKLTAEDTQFIYEQVEKAAQAIDEETKQRELSKIENRINDKLPPEDGQTIKALRRIAMLFNPKTQVRNIVGNTLIMPVNDIADVIGAGIDRIVARKTGTRTTGLPNPITKAKGFAKGVKSAITDYKTGTRTTGSGSKYEFDIGAKPFNENTDSKVKNAINNKLNGINNLLSAVMSGGDRPFYEAAYKNSLDSQMKANKVKEPTQDMIDIAVNEALQRTWNDDNEYTKFVLGLRKAFNNKYMSIHGFGFGDLILPFAKTPANLSKAMVEYSPAGFIGAALNYADMSRAISRGEMTPQQQKKFVSSMSKAIAGTLLYAFAGTLVKAGKITGSADDDKDVKNFEQNVLGIQPYSVRLGDKTYTYSWANPINAPLAIMADSYKMSKEDAKLYDQLYNAIKVAGNVLLDNSFLQGISDIFTHQEGPVAGIIESIMSMPESMIPTFLSQIASLGDDTQRQTYEYKNKGQSVINRVKNKIPGARNTLEPKVNTFGEEIENQNNLFNAFLNPANVREARTTEAQKEIYSLYEATGDKTIFPMQAPNSVTKNGENTNLTNAQKNRYQKGSGQYATEVYGDLFDSDYYDSISNTQKTDLLQRVAQDANKMGKTEVGVWTEDTFKVDERYNELEDRGIPLADYYIAWSAQKDVTSDKDENGKTITLSASKKKKDAIDDAVDNLNKKQMEYLYEIFDISEKVW